MFNIIDLLNFTLPPIISIDLLIFTLPLIIPFVLLCFQKKITKICEKINTQDMQFYISFAFNEYIILKYGSNATDTKLQKAYRGYLTQKEKYYIHYIASDNYTKNMMHVEPTIIAISIFIITILINNMHIIEHNTFIFIIFCVSFGIFYILFYQKFILKIKLKNIIKNELLLLFIKHHEKTIKSRRIHILNHNTNFFLKIIHKIFLY